MNSTQQLNLFLNLLGFENQHENFCFGCNLADVITLRKWLLSFSFGAILSTVTLLPCLSYPRNNCVHRLSLPPPPSPKFYWIVQDYFSDMGQLKINKLVSQNDEILVQELYICGFLTSEILVNGCKILSKKGELLSYSLSADENHQSSAKVCIS